jgi:hypothetical protein
VTLKRLDLGNAKCVLNFSSPLPELEYLDARGNLSISGLRFMPGLRQLAIDVVDDALANEIVEQPNL